MKNFGDTSFSRREAERKILQTPSNELNHHCNSVHTCPFFFLGQYRETSFFLFLSVPRAAAHCSKRGAQTKRASKSFAQRSRSAMSLLLLAFVVVAALSLAQYLVPHLLLCLLCRDQDLVRRYKAKWGLVTGASSGKNRFSLFRLAMALDGAASLSQPQPPPFPLSTSQESASPWPKSFSPRALT